MFKFFGKRNTAALAALVVAAVAGVGAYAFTANNSVPAEYAGAGTATVTGYTATNISYTFSADTTKINAVSFDLDHSASDAAVALVDDNSGSPSIAAANYTDCGPSSGGSNTVTCTFATPLSNGPGVQDLYIAAVTSGSVTLQ